MNDSRQAIYRILDASLNRAAEGIRTVEEYARFVLNEVDLAEKTKTLRHRLAEASSLLPRTSLLAARDVQGDVGTEIESESEYIRQRGSHVVTAASQRVGQSLRVLEEYGKTISKSFAKEIESIRYLSYSVLRDVELNTFALARQSRLVDARLYVLLDCGESEQQFLKTVEELASAGVDVFQLRDKSADDRTLIRRASLGVEAARERGSLFLLNDRADLALAAQTDGVHLGQSELPVQHARTILGHDSIIGVSTHSLDQVHQAIAEGADYLGCGPTFRSETKGFDEYPGLDFLSQVHQATSLTPRPAFAIGGICADNIGQVLSSGFHRIAVTAAIHKSEDPVGAARQLKRLLTERDA